MKRLLIIMIILSSVCVSADLYDDVVAHWTFEDNSVAVNEKGNYDGMISPMTEKDNMDNTWTEIYANDIEVTQYSGYQRFERTGSDGSARAYMSYSAFDISDFNYYAIRARFHTNGDDCIGIRYKNSTGDYSPTNYFCPDIQDEWETYYANIESSSYGAVSEIHIYITGLDQDGDYVDIDSVGFSTGNRPDLTSTPSGQGYNFTGNQYIDFGNVSQWEGSGAIEAYFKVNQNTSQRIFITNGDYSPSIQIRVDSAGTYTAYLRNTYPHSDNCYLNTEIGDYGHYVISFNETDTVVYEDGAPICSIDFGGDFSDDDQFIVGRYGSSDSDYAYSTVDYIKVYDTALTASDVSLLYNENAPVIAGVNCTSCGGDMTEPYDTSDTTPTFRFNTSVSAKCRIGNHYLNYTEMGQERDCSSGAETNNHVCTLRVEDELIFAQDLVYLSCENIFNRNATISTLIMNITDLEANYTAAINQGVQDSVIWPGAEIYNDEAVFLKNLEGDKVTAEVDTVVIYGNQRWIINVADDPEASPLGLFNITPVVYVLDLVDTSLSEIPGMVTGLINATKN